jgi:tuftelin-interacting protein 11
MSHFELDDSDDSVIHQDSDDDDQVERDDDIDIGFRRHQYAFGKQKRLRKEDAIYGVFYEEDRESKRSKITESAPMFVSASKTKESTPMFVSASKEEEQPTFVAASKKEPESSSSSIADATDSNPQQKAEGESKESQEDVEVSEKQKAADEYFLSLLKKGRGRQRPKPRNSTFVAVKRPEEDEEPPATGLGGLGNLPSSFGRMSQQGKAEAPKIQTNMGKWERHTKGIGSKLLGKMGWAGNGGLGSNRRKLKKEKESNDGSADKTVETIDASTTDKQSPKARKGISRPVEVVVRPASLGLGFGNFKEASQLKANRQIEAEVRGIELLTEKKKTKEEEDRNAVSWGPDTVSSAISTTDELLSLKRWKRVRNKKAPKLKVIPYNELIDQQQKKEGQPIIIDMRGPAAEKETKTDDGQVPLGAELLHNVSFLLNTYENKLHSSSHFLKTTEQKCTSFKTDIEDMERRKEDGDNRISKLKSILSIVDHIEGLTQKHEANGKTENLLKDVQKLIHQLGDEFTAEERQSLNFWETLAPAMLSPVIKIQLDRWDPLEELSSSKNVVDLIFTLGQYNGSGDQSYSARSLCNSIIQSQLLPKIKQSLESSRWIANRDTDIALDLYEYVYQKALNSVTHRRQSGDSDKANDDNGVFIVDNDLEEVRDRNNLAQTVKKVLIFDAIYPKIQNSLGLWKPKVRSTKSGVQIDERPDLWILPWLPYLDHSTILPNLVPDCRRKIKSCIEYLHRKTSDDRLFLRASIDTLKPWQRVFDPKAVHRLVSDTITPRLARFLGKQKIQQNGIDQDWHALEIILEMHDSKLLSNIECISIIEGEVLAKWAAFVHGSLLVGGDVSQAALSYTQWKFHMLTKKYVPDCSLQLFRSDEYICRIFYSVLKMIEISNKLQRDELDEIAVTNSNFRVVLARRTKEEQRSSEVEFIRFQSQSVSEIEARIRLQRRSVHTPTFKEVVEEFAKEKGILFQPRMGSNALKDGRQTFQFGETPIYIEGDVIYASKGHNWQAIALDELAKV